MSLNPEIHQIETLGQPTDAAEPEVNTPLTIAPPYEPSVGPQAPPWEAQVVAVPARARRRPGWIVPGAIAVVGLMASGTLGYFLYTTSGQRDAARHQLAATKATLADTSNELAVRKATDAYTQMYVLNSGKVQTDYQSLFVCDTYSTCRSAAQDTLTDMKAFQSARAATTVPSALASADSQLGDALSAAIAADQQVIKAMDGDDLPKLDAAYKKLNEALLSFAKAESALAVALG